MCGARAYLSPELGDIVVRAERVFSRPAPDTLGVCTGCCMAPKVEKAILATPVSKITAEQLTEWYGAAFASDIGFGVLQWLMPAILRHLAQDTDVSFTFGREVAFKRCAQTTRWPGWPESQAALFADFARAYLDARLDLPMPELDETFCMFSHAGLPMQALTDQLESTPLLRLARALLADFDWAMPVFGANAFWDDHAAAREIAAWFARPALRESLIVAGVETDGPNADAMLGAADVLESFACSTAG